MTEIIILLLQILSIALLVAGIFSTLLGLLVLFHIAKPKKSPADSSNRINHIRLIWFAITRPELFTNTFPWLKNDELENVKDVK